MLGRAKLLYESGFSVLLFDAQAHGESPEDKLTFGYLETDDASAVVDYIKSRNPDLPIGYIGVSLGGAVALLRDEPLPVQALVPEAVYPSLYVAVTNRIGMLLGPFSRLFAHALLVQIKPWLGVRPAQLAPEVGIMHSKAPKLIVAGARDWRTTLEDTNRLYELASSPEAIWVLPEARHQDFNLHSRDEYERRTLDFFRQHLRVG